MEHEGDIEPMDAAEVDADEDERDDAVIGADDTGMLAGEQLITNAEIAEGLEGDV